MRTSTYDPAAIPAIAFTCWRFYRIIVPYNYYSLWARPSVANFTPIVSIFDRVFNFIQLE